MKYWTTVAFSTVVTVALHFVVLQQHLHATDAMNTAAAAAATTATRTMIGSAHVASRGVRRVIRIPEPVWRQAASDHQDRIKALLEPALLPSSDSQHRSGIRRQKNRKNNKNHEHSCSDENFSNSVDDDYDGWFTALDPKNPVCNFLIEYYGLRGVKGTKRLARWSPSPNLLLQTSDEYGTVQELLQASRPQFSMKELIHQQQTEDSGILLEGASAEDMASLLHLKGATWEATQGAMYSPALWYDRKMNISDQNSRKHPASPFLWYRAILKQTLQAEPVLHCHGLHEWAMQYQPAGEPEPPSAKYQAHLPLRVSRHVINQAVERKGISCTHVDALRFFAKAAGPLNHHGSRLKRDDQLRLEQPACVHAQMDLLKIALRLQPFCNPELLQQILELAMDARRLDVAASPYDATEYGIGVIPVETKEGRALYRKEQRHLMERAEPLRLELLESYDTFLNLAFGEDSVGLEAQVKPS